ncbi:MAG: hypothetical protein M1347_00650 [Chloroflexi bacterium]|nr:hypothetical protein [Chloroflexota bacterium]
MRLWGVLSSWDYLSSLPLTVTPAYLGLSAAGWIALGATLAWGLWRAKAWVPHAIRWAALAFAAVLWLDRSFLQAKGPQSSNWLFDLLFTLLLMASVIGVLAFPKVRHYFGEPHE